MLRPGNICMRSGQWYIDTAFKGFRPKRMKLDDKFIRQQLSKTLWLAPDPLLESRIRNWASDLDNKKEIAKDMKYRAKQLDGPIKNSLLEIAQWLQMIGQVKFGGNN